ncbi:MAG: hypothetical protein Q4G68_08315 [Planctomycetia bacterium]|nr:hypothetical protein [Planctomycetia bacterium]
MNVYYELIDLIKEYIDAHDGNKPNTVLCTCAKSYDFLKLNTTTIGEQHCGQFQNLGVKYCEEFIKLALGMNFVVVPKSEISQSGRNMEVTFQQ